MQQLLDTRWLVWAMACPSGCRLARQELPALAHYALMVATLPRLHRDPYDRLLLAQASAKGVILITADQQLSAYSGPVRLMAAR
jgi:PIN domain nuclease of toxin-antitoxin system